MLSQLGINVVAFLAAFKSEIHCKCWLDADRHPKTFESPTRLKHACGETIGHKRYSIKAMYHPEEQGYVISV